MGLLDSTGVGLLSKANPPFPTVPKPTSSGVPLSSFLAPQANLLSTQTSTPQTNSGLDTLGVAKGIGQGLLRIPAEIGATAAQAGLSLFDLSQGTNYTAKTDQGLPTGSMAGLLGEAPVKGLGSQILDTKEAIQQSPLAQKYGLDKQAGLLAFAGVVGGEALNLDTGGGLKGLAGLTDAVKGAKTAEQVSSLMKKAGFADDIIQSYAPKLAPLTDSKQIQKGLLSAQTLQNTTKTTGLLPPYKESGDLTTKLLTKLEGRTTVSKQFIEDLSNSPDLKQPERDLIRNVLADQPKDVNVTDFANKVKSELLPLETQTSASPTRPNRTIEDYALNPRYESINLPDELRGQVYDYRERIYKSPIKTSAGDVHFQHGGKSKENYFAHSRIEDLPGASGKNAKGTTRRVIELQSDLFQKQANSFEYNQGHQMQPDEIKALDPYRNTWHERVIREEVKQAAKDGKTKLQFPTGETAMKIEGLGDNNEWFDMETGNAPHPDNLKVGQAVQDSSDTPWIITDVLGDGKFKAVPKDTYDKIKSNWTHPEAKQSNLEGVLRSNSEQFDISGKVDTNNPIYKFYEKEVGKYLKNKYGATLVTDPQGVKWWEVNVPKALAKAPVEAFGATAGIQTDENGKVKFNPAMATLGILGAGFLKGKGSQAEKYVAEQLAKRATAKGGSTLLSGVDNFLKDAKAKIVDFTAPIEDVLNAATKREGIKLSPTEDIHNQIDRVLRAPTLAGQFAKDNGLVDVIRKVDNINNLDQYLIAKHAIELDTRGITTGRDLTKDQELVKEFASKYEPYAKQVKAYSDALLDKSVETGLISKELATTLRKRYPDYVPFQRVFEDIEQHGGSGGVASLSRQTVVQSIKGSEREIESPLESLLAKTNDVFKQGEKNVAGKLLAGYEKLPNNPFELKEINGFVDDTTGRKMFPHESAKDTISFFDNGEKRVFKTTPEIANAAKSLNVQQLNILGRILALPTRIARIGITGINLPFVAANLAKDQVSAFINTDHALRTSIANPPVFLNSLFNAVGHGKLYDEWIRAGGGGTSFDLSRNQVESSLKGIRAGRNIGSKIAYTVTHPSELLRTVENIVARSEEMTRLQQYAGSKQALLSKGMDTANAVTGAARQSRESTVNFARRGEWGTVLNSAWLYLNASIQGTRTLLRNLKTKPFSTSAKIAVSAMLPMAYATAWNLSDPKRKEAYQDISDYEKQNNLIIIPPDPVKDAQGRWNVIKIPLSQEINNLVGLARRPIEQMNGLDPINFNDFAQALIGTVSPVAPNQGAILSTAVPQAIKPTVEAATNTNLFTGRHPITMGLENQPPAKQVKPWTSGTARQIGDRLNISPIKVEEWIKATFGGVGSQALNAVDHALAATGVIPKDQIGGQEILDAISARFNKAQGGQIANQQYEANLLATQQKASARADAYAKVQDLMKQGKTAEATAITKAMSPEDYTAYKTTKTRNAHLATYQQIKDLVSQGKVQEATKLTSAMTKTEYKAYQTWKKNNP